MRNLKRGAGQALLIIAAFTSTTTLAQSGPTFLQGDWTVSSDYVRGDGSIEQTTAAARAAEETIVGTTTQIRHTLVGTREGQDVEVTTTFARNPADARWVMMQADSIAGTVDVAAGEPNPAGDEWTFTSLVATRPDGGLSRFHYTGITADSFYANRVAIL